MQQFSVYLKNPLVYNLVFKVLDHNFNNSQKTNDFLSLLSDTLVNGNDLQILRDYLKNNELSFTTESNRVDSKVYELSNLIGELKIDSILDLGCGNGHILNSLIKKLNISPVNSYGIDIVDYLDNVNFNYIQYGSNETVPLLNESTDLVTCMMVLHHTEEPEHYIKEIHRILKPKGKFIVRETDAYLLDLLHFNLLMEFIFYDIIFNIPVKITRNYFSKSEWIHLFESNGFKVIKQTSQSIKDNAFTPFYLLMEKI